ncbi:hypothetical protein [Parafrankia discariae]|uniref:hypothetical protein n=1 Tax=Parafrankia discariae TaxID=365528 RepID=UPI000380BBC9|nr:hypothetical protein [Parafrankia discariae]
MNRTHELKPYSDETMRRLHRQRKLPGNCLTDPLLHGPAIAAWQEWEQADLVSFGEAPDLYPHVPSTVPAVWPTATVGQPWPAEVYENCGMEPPWG